MKNRKLVSSALFVVGCALVSIGLGLPTSTTAQNQSTARVMEAPPVNLTRATSIQNVSKIRSQLLESIDAALASAQVRGGETTVANTKINKEVLDKTLVKTTTSRVAMKGMSESELKGLREIISSRFDQAILTRNAEGTLSSSIFTGKVLVKQPALLTAPTMGMTPTEFVVPKP